MELETGPFFYRFNVNNKRFPIIGIYVMDQILNEGAVHTFYQRTGSLYSFEDAPFRRIIVPIHSSRLVSEKGNLRWIKTNDIRNTLVWPTPPEGGRTPLVQEWLDKALELDKNYFI